MCVVLSRGLVLGGSYASVLVLKLMFGRAVRDEDEGLSRDGRWPCVECVLLMCLLTVLWLLEVKLSPP
jgi:hypothetical protein